MDIENVAPCDIASFHDIFNEQVPGTVGMTKELHAVAGVRGIDSHLKLVISQSFELKQDAVTLECMFDSLGAIISKGSCFLVWT